MNHVFSFVRFCLKSLNRLGLVMDLGHPNLMGRRGDGTRQRRDGTQTCKATCKPNAGEEGGTVASARWREGKGRGMAQQGKHADLAMNSSSQIKLMTFKKSSTTNSHL